MQKTASATQHNKIKNITDLRFIDIFIKDYPLKQKP
jgi:hypothetical protein